MRQISGLADVVRLRTWQLGAGAQTEWPLSWIAALDPERPQRPVPQQALREPELPDSLTALQTSQDIRTLPLPKVPPPAVPSVRSPLQCAQWVVTHAERTGPAQETAVQTPPLPHLHAQDYTATKPGAPPTVPLAPPTRWWPALRALAPKRMSGLAVEATVRLLARACLPQRLPLRPIVGTHRNLQIWRDTGKAMVPYASDFDAVAHELRRRPIAMHTTEHCFQGYLPPSAPSGDALLILSDLGANGTRPHSAALTWAKTLRALLRRGVHVAVWAPTSAARVATELAQAVSVVPFHEGSRFRPCAGVQVQDPAPGGVPAWQHDAQNSLLPWLAVTQRVEPALLRRLRRLAGGYGKPEWEQALWQHCAHTVGGENVLQMLPQDRPHWRAVFATLSTGLQLAQWNAMAAQHAHLPRSTLFAEQLLWGNYARPEARRAVAGQLGVVHDWFARLVDQERANSQAHAALAQAGLPHALHQDFVRDFLQRNVADANFGQQHEILVSRLGVAAGMPGHNAGVSDVQWLHAVPLSDEVAALPWGVNWQRLGATSQFFKAMASTNLPAKGPSGTVLQAAHWTNATWRPEHGALQFLDNSVQHWAAQAGTLTASSALGTQEFHIDTLHRQPWQHALGRDRYGVFCEVLVKEQILCLRYISPGTFLMGSPDFPPGTPFMGSAEDAGANDEYSRHPVAITEGFWLADTPCTQKLWMAVMGDNPSKYKEGTEAPQRPVEQVSFNDVAVFLDKLEGMLPAGCKPALPTEAEWEYAARAGTTTKYWWGDDPGSDRAHWNWEKKATMPVKCYAANPWGLYDTYGNVWEWCADHWGAPLHVVPGDVEDHGARVVRGGSWLLFPGSARTGFRHGWDRDFRFLNQGFRVVLKSSNSMATNISNELDIQLPEGPGFVLNKAPLVTGSVAASESATGKKRN